MTERKRGKRGQNEGGCYQRKDGRWEASLTIPADVPGGPMRRSFYGATKADAMAKLKTAMKQLDAGSAPVPEKQTVGDFLGKWLEEAAKPTIRPKTYQSYALLVNRHLVPGLGHHRLAHLAPQHVQTFLNDKLAAGLSPRTVQYLRAVLRRALGQALKWGLVTRNVATLVDPPRSIKHEIRPLSPAQARKLLDAVKGDRLEALYSVALALGLRQGEALGLRWDDVDFDAGSLSVRHALQRLDGKLCLVEPKTDRSRRTLPLPASVAASLQAHRDRQAFERSAAGETWADTLLVFCTPKGTGIDARNAVRRFKGALRGAGLPDVRWHDMRHTAASLLLAQGVGPRTVMEVLGHSQISLTMDTYAHVMPEMTRQAADLMDRLLTANG